MATVPLPERPNMDQLRRRARELQRGIRAGEPAVLRLAGLEGADPEFPLVAAQLALARRHGFASWARLKHHVEQIQARTWSLPPASGGESDADRFVRLSCVSYDPSGILSESAAWRLFAQRDGLLHAHIAAAAAAADAEAIHAHVTAGADVDAPSGPFGWPALMYLAYSRLYDGEGRILDAARALLDAGADPNAGRYFGGFPTPFTVLTGVFGDGERGEPSHPHALALARLLLERGANPNDAQTLYHRQFSETDDFLELLLEFGLGTGDGGPWRRRLPDLTSPPTELVRILLDWAVTPDQRARVALLAAHGVDVISPLPIGPMRTGRTPLEVALANGHAQLAARLRELGAVEPEQDPVKTFIGAALAGDAGTVAATPLDVVAAARELRPGLVVWAAAQSAPAAVALLLDTCFDIDALGRGDVPVEQPWQTALHSAVQRGDPAMVAFLLAHGADRTVRDARFDATPLKWAAHFGHPHLADLFAQP